MILLLLAVACHVEPALGTSGQPDVGDSAVVIGTSDTSTGTVIVTADTGGHVAPDVDEEDAFFRILAMGDDSTGLGRVPRLIDLDHDGRLEAVSGWLAGIWIWAIPDGGGEVTTADALWHLPGEGTGWIDIADFDGDGHDDMVTFSKAGFGDDLLRIHLTPFPEKGVVDLVGMQKGRSSPIVAVADFDGNGHPDIAHIANGDSLNLISVYFGPFSPGTSVTPGSTYSYLSNTGFSSIYSEGDLTGDGYANLIVDMGRFEFVREPLLPGHFSDEHYGSEKILGVFTNEPPMRVGPMGPQGTEEVLLFREAAGIDDFVAAMPLPLVIGSSPLVSLNMEFDNRPPYLWTAGDVDGDGFTDVWLTSGRVPIRQHLVLGPFEEGAVIDASLEWDYRIASDAYSVWMGDVDGDGVLDVLFGRPGVGAFLHLIKGLPD